MKFRGVSFEFEKATRRLICVELTAGSKLMFLITVRKLLEITLYTCSAVMGAQQFFSIEHLLQQPRKIGLPQTFARMGKSIPSVFEGQCM